jgi:ArsR family transcriptional regulator
LSLLSAKVRVRLLRLLELEELGVGELARVTQLPQSTVSRHLKLLREGDWVGSRKEGTSSLFAFSDELSTEDRALWEVVREATDGEHSDDGWRLAAVLAERPGDSRAFFGRVAEGWLEVRRELFGDRFLRHVFGALLPPSTVVADLGCGTGEVLEILAPHGARLIGVDREPAMLEAARRRLAQHDHVDVREGSLETPPLGAGEVDVALLMLVLHHVAQPEEVLRGLAGALRPSGRVVMVDMLSHERLEYRRTMGHVHLGFSEEDVTRWAQQTGFSLMSWNVLSPETTASGPPLFVAVLRGVDACDADGGGSAGA